MPTEAQLVELALQSGPWVAVAILALREARGWVAHLCEGASRGIAAVERLSDQGLTIHLDVRGVDLRSLAGALSLAGQRSSSPDVPPTETD